MGVGPGDPGLAGGGASDEERLVRLLAAVTAVTSDLALEAVLHRVVEAACVLVGARYGALGIVDEAREGLAAFVHHGLPDEEVARIGALPAGRGVLGLLVREPRPLRLDDLAGHPDAVGVPANHPPMHAFLGVPIEVRGSVWGNLYLTEKVGGGPFDATDEALVVGLAAVAGSAVANARLYEETRLRVTSQRAAVDVAAAVLAAEAPPDVRARIATLARDVAHGDASLVVDGEEGAGVVLGIAGEVGVVVGQRVDDPASSLGGPAAWVPVRDGTRTVARLGVRSSAGVGPRAHEALAVLADQVGLAWAFERAQADSLRLGVVEERERIGRDLHDTVIQRLFATGLALQAALRQLPDGGDPARRVTDAVDAIDATVKEIRSTIFALQTDAARDEGVRARLLVVVDEVGALLASPPRVRFDGPIDTVVPRPVADALVPVLREALTNVVKHAGAREVEVTLRADARGVELVVRDDGAGLPVRGRRGGLGLVNLGERAAALGGTFEASAAPEGGTLLAWRVPLVRA